MIRDHFDYGDNGRALLPAEFQQPQDDQPSPVMFWIAGALACAASFGAGFVFGSAVWL